MRGDDDPPFRKEPYQEAASHEDDHHHEAPSRYDIRLGLLIVATLVLTTTIEHVSLLVSHSDAVSWSSVLSACLFFAALAQMVWLLFTISWRETRSESILTTSFGRYLNTLHRWLAQSPIFVMIVIAVAIVRAFGMLFAGHEAWYTTPITAFAAGYGGYLVATWITYTYHTRHSPRELSEADVSANVDRLLTKARMAIDRNNELVAPSTRPSPPGRRAY